MSALYDESGLLCDWLGEFFLPSFSLRLQHELNQSVFDFLFNNASRAHSHDLNKHLYFDLIKYFSICIQFESNLVYLYWLFNLFKPLLIIVFVTLFLLPSSIFLFIYASSFIMFLTKHWSKLKKEVYKHDIRQASFKSIAIFWEALGAIWHGHELIGLENIPDKGSALYIYYHAAMPIDFYIVHSKILLYKNRRMNIVCDRFLFKLPGLSSLLEAFEAIPGSFESCVKLLNNGHLLSISPGGVREALFSDHNYEVLWGNRTGFARVAVEAKCSVIPVFTENCREALRTFPYFKKIFRFIYEKTRLPLVPIYGFFPVKLRTHIGKPILYDESRTAEQLKALTKLKIEEMIRKHQRLPGNIFDGILDRFRRK